LLCQAFAEAHPERKVVKKWVTAKIKEIADHGMAGWVIKREHTPIQLSQDPAVGNEGTAAGGVLSIPVQATPAMAKPPGNAEGMSSFEHLDCICVCVQGFSHALLL